MVAAVHAAVELAAALAAEAKPDSLRPAHEWRFWQRFLSAEIPAPRSHDILAAVSELSSETAAIGFLESCPRLTEAERNRMCRIDLAKAERAASNGAQITLREDFPERLSHGLPNLVALWTQGDFGIVRRPTVAIVGTRGASPYGKACAIKFAEALAKAGVTIVSGGAHGIDIAAHKGALEAGGSTVVALPCGIDLSYPAAHRPVFDEIRQKGCLISMFGCGIPPRTDTPLARNFVVAAISDATLVIEAPAKSGALHTANRAAEMGRQVYVVPAAISQATFQGSHDLIRHGATLVDHPYQILEDLNIDPPSVATPNHVDVSPIARKILEALGPQPTSAEKLAVACALEPQEVMAELTLLELEGRILRSSGGFSVAP